MSRLEELLTLRRELTDSEVRAIKRLLRPPPPSAQPEAKRACWARNAAGINARRRAKYARDPEFRERLLASNRASHARRRGK